MQLDTMNCKHLTVDERPGPLPEIRSDGDSVTFALPLREISADLWLVVRCDATGDVWVSSITSAASPE